MSYPSGYSRLAEALWKSSEVHREQENEARAALLKRLDLDIDSLPVRLADRLPKDVLEYYLIGRHLAREQPEFRTDGTPKPGAPKKKFTDKAAVQMALLINRAQEMMREAGKEPLGVLELIHILKSAGPEFGLKMPRTMANFVSTERLKNAVSEGRKALEEEKARLIDLLGPEAGTLLYESQINDYLHGRHE